MVLLDIRNLTIRFSTAEGIITVIDRLNLTLNEGEIRGLVGESGSGKSLIAKAICGVIQDNCLVSADRFRLNGIDLLKLSPRRRRKWIGNTISMIFQEPQSCLDPMLPIGKQLIQVIPRRTFKGKWWQRFYWRKQRAIELLHRVGIRDHKTIMHCYPYELTEGECQKVMIAIALANRPHLLIADEPTNAMESATQAQIFRLLEAMHQNNNTSILLISHDLQIMGSWADRIDVLYYGQVVESAPAEELLSSPHHPYTNALIRALPDLQNKIPFKSRLNTLAGSAPTFAHLPIGCRLGPRCPYAQRQCNQTPQLRTFKGRSVACHYPLNDYRTMNNAPLHNREEW